MGSHVLFFYLENRILRNLYTLYKVALTTSYIMLDL